MPVYKRYDIGKAGSLTKYWEGEHRIGGSPETVISARKIKEQKLPEYHPPAIKPPVEINLPALSESFNVFKNKNSGIYFWDKNSIIVKHNFKTLHIDYVVRWNGLHQVICQDELIDGNTLKIYFPQNINLSPSDFYQIIIFPISTFDEILTNWNLPKTDFTYNITVGNLELLAGNDLWKYYFCVFENNGESQYAIQHNLETENIKVICRNKNKQKIYVQYTIEDKNSIILHIDNTIISQLENILIYTNTVSKNFNWDTEHNGWLYSAENNISYTDFNHNFNCFTRMELISKRTISWIFYVF